MRGLVVFITFFMLNLSYMQLPQYLYLALVLLYLFITGVFLHGDKRFLEFSLQNKLIYFLFFVVIISYLNTNNEDVSIKSKVIDILNWIACFLFFVNHVRYCIERNKNPFVAVGYALIVFVTLNLIIFVFFGNIRSSTPDIDNVFFKIITGITINKVNFLIGSLSINHNSILIGFLSPFLFFIKSKILRLTSFFLAGVALILLDNRMSILAILLSITLFVPLNKMKLSRVVKFVALVLPLTVIILTIVLPLLPLISGLEFFSRNSEELFTANSRTLIWVSVIEIITQINFNTLFGLGDYGNLAYAENLDYLDIFVNYENSNIKTCHNTYLQMILDKGYFFFIIFYSFLIKYLNNLFKLRNVKLIQLLSISTMIFLICATTEVIFGAYFMPITILFLMIPLFVNNFNIQGIKQYEV